MLFSITWEVDPAIFTIFGREIRWYGLFFAFGLLAAAYIVDRIFKHEKHPDNWYNSLFIYMIVGIVVGARLGHMFFYEPARTLANPMEIFRIWEGGLASHGGVIGIIIAVWLYSRKVTKESILWTLDRVMVPTGLTAAMIRFGNLTNHEIFGGPTDAPWGFRFVENTHHWMRGAEPVFTDPSHPTQIYEALVYLLVFGITMYMYWKTTAVQREGLITGVGILMIFVARFFIEFIKHEQVAFEYGMLLNMGQLLSIPFIAWGVWLIVRAMKQKPLSP